MTSLGDDEDELTLPIDTLCILNEFIIEKANREREEQCRISDKSGTNSMFEENWQLSQFWYSDKTKTALKLVIGKLLGSNTRVALLSCPSLYRTIKNIHHYVKIFEFDNRFSVFGDDFIFYDFNEPEYFDKHDVHYDIIIADPPFLSEECIKKTAQIITKLKQPDGKIIFCSGQVVEPWVVKYLNLKRCNFRPEHERNLGNPFVCYANFNLDQLL